MDYVSTISFMGLVAEPPQQLVYKDGRQYVRFKVYQPSRENFLGLVGNSANFVECTCWSGTVMQRIMNLDINSGDTVLVNGRFFTRSYGQTQYCKIFIYETFLIQKRYAFKKPIKTEDINPIEDLRTNVGIDSFNGENVEDDDYFK